MQLMNLFATLTLDKSGYDSGLRDAESQASSLGSKITNVFGGIAKAATAGLAAGAALVGALTKQSVDAYASYEQLVGGVETLFKESSDTVLAYAQNAYKTSGMSANQYMSTVTSFAAALIQSVAGASQQASQLTAQDVSAMKDALDDKYDAQKRSLDKQYNAQREAFDRQYDEARKAYDAEYDALKEALDKEYSEQKKAFDKEYQQRKTLYDRQYEEKRKALDKEYQAQKEAMDEEYEARAEAYAEETERLKEELDDRYETLQKSLEKQVEAAQKSDEKRLNNVMKAQEREVDAYNKATEEKIALIDKQYAESLKLIDKDEYERVKAIDAQIKAIQDQTEAEEKEKERQEEQEKETQLRNAVRYAKYNYERQEAEKELNEFLENVALKHRKEERKDQVESLKQQKESIKEETDQRRDAAKEKHDIQVKAAKEERADGLKELKEAQKEQLDALKESNKERISAMKEINKERLDALKKSNTKELKETQSQNEKELKELRKAQQKKLDQTKENNEETLQQLKETQETRLANLRESQENELEETRKGNEHQLKALKESNDAKLENLRSYQNARLQSLKESNEDYLKEMKRSIDAEKKALDESAQGTSASVEATAEDRQKAAELAEMAAKDMSDNANKMGTDLASIQAAYQGFSKQNFTMLDNLKLGYGGTKTEMERLLRRAEELNGLELGTYSTDNFADVVQAIHAVQENLGITGTTAKEAATTIEGAMNATKAAWENLLVGLTDPDADLDQLIDNLIVALVGDKEGEGLLNQLLPAIERALKGIGTFIEKAAPIIAEHLPGLMNAILPSLLSAAATLLLGLAQALPGLAVTLVEQIPVIVQMLVDGFWENLETFKEVGGGMLQNILDGINEKYPELGEALSGLIDTVKGIIEDVQAFWAEHGDEIVSNVQTAFTTIRDFIAGALTVILNAINFFIQGAKSFWDEFGDDILELVNAIKEYYEAVAKWIDKKVKEFQKFWKEHGDEITKIAKTAWKIIGGEIKTALDIATGVIQAFTALINGDWQGFFEAITGTADTAWKDIDDIFDTVLNEVIMPLVEDFFDWLLGFVGTDFDTVKQTISDAWDFISGVFDTVNDIKDKVEEAFNKVQEFMEDPVSAAKETIGNVIEDIKDMFDFDWSLPELKLPHISVDEYMEVPGLGTVPAPWGVHVDWYRKAYDNPYLFTKPTQVGNKGFGDGGSGGEIVYGRNNLMEDITEAMKRIGNRTFAPTINVYTQEGQSNREIANAVIEIMERQYRDRESVYV